MATKGGGRPVSVDLGESAPNLAAFAAAFYSLLTHARQGLDSSA
jgi:hypothetical protein